MGKEVELLEAARTGNVATVEKLLSNKSRKSHVGGAFGQKLSSFLKSVNVNYTDKNGYTALHHASVNGHRDIVEILLKADAQPGIVDTQGCTPVHLAAWNGNAEIVMQLLTAGHDSDSVDPVNINQQNGTGDTALHCAAQYGHVAVVDVLLNKSATPTIRNLNEASPLDLAAQYGRLEVVQRLLITHPELAHHPSSTQSPLHLASRNGHRDIVEHLLDNSFDIQTVTEDGSALHEAALHGKLDVVKLLLERGIDINHRDQKPQTVLELLSAHKSQQKSFTEIMQAIRNSISRADVVSGLYDSLANCQASSIDKPTAAVKPLPPDKPSPSDKPHPSDKPNTSDVQGEQVEKSPVDSTRKTERPVPSPRKSLGSPDKEVPVLALYSSVMKERSGSFREITTKRDRGPPPPLPPRSSSFSVHDEKQSPPATQPTDIVPPSKTDKSPKTMSIPKKPPRQKKSPLPVRNLKTESATDVKPSPLTQTETFQNIPNPHTDIPSAQSDNLDTDATLSEKHSEDQSKHSSTSSSDLLNASLGSKDQLNSSIPDEKHQSDSSLDADDLSCSSAVVSGQAESSKLPCKPPVNPKPALPKRPSVPKNQIDNSVDPVTGAQVQQSFYMEMTAKQSNQSTSKKPVSEVKPQITSLAEKSKSNLQPTKPVEDNYGILFKNLKKDQNKRGKTTSEEAEYVRAQPISPTGKFKDKLSQLPQTNTVPEGNYMLMSNVKKNGDHQVKEDQRVDTEHKENLYAEIGPKRDQPIIAPMENLYATIAETKQVKEVEKNEYMEIGDVRPQQLPMRNGSANATDVKVSPKPNCLEFMKSKPGTPLTPTGYPQPPTPDFPPPSPATAMMGIELKIQQIDTKRKSRDITTLTDDTLESIEEQRSEVKVTAEAEKVKVIGGTESSKSDIAVSDKSDSKLEVKTEKSSVSFESDQNLNKKVEDITSETDKKLKVTPDYGVIIERPSVIDSSDTKVSESSIPVYSVIGTRSAKSEQSDSTQSSSGEPVNISEVKAMEEASGNQGDEKGSPVVMRKKSANPDMDVFKGLLRGSTIGGPPKVGSQFYNEVIRHSHIRNSDTVPVKPKMEKEEDIDVDKVMESIDDEVAKRASTSDTGNFDDSEEWAKIADIMSSFGGNLTTSNSSPYSTREEEFNIAFEAYMDNLLSKRERGSGQMISVGEWLESVGLPQYENAFVASGYDNIDFLDHKILEEGDLEQIGVLSHEHRQKILHATKSLPQLPPIDANNPPSSVEEWLMSLQLLDYLETFRSHGYDTMEKVQSILWELQLRTVLDISMLGHRKRILASLGERKQEKQGSQKKRSISSLSPEESRSPFNNIDLFKDYTRVKPVSSSEEDIKESSQMVVDSSEDEDVFKKQSGQSIQNSNIHLRPPHMAQTSSPARQWRHRPEMLIKGCCNYTAQYLGSTIVPELTGGTESTRAGITKLKKSADVLAKIPIILLSISYKGVKFIDAKSKKVICDHEIGNIFCACQDTDNLNFFAYITRDIQTGQHYCHVFSVKSASLAHDIILTLGESFEVAYQMALKEKAMVDAMELDRKMSQSDQEDAYSTKSSLSTNTV